MGDIERVEVIKGGAAATLYGSEAANGVVQIFTRKGKAGAPRWKFSVEQGLNSPEKKFIIEDFTRDYVMQNGHFQKYTASVDGGSTILTYHLSGHILGEDGVMKKLENVRYGLAGGFRAFPSDKLQIDFSSNLVRNNFGRVFSDNAISGILSTIEAHDAGFFHDGITEEEQLQLLDEYFMPELDEIVNRFTFATTAMYNPSAYLSTRFTLGADYRKSEQRYFIPISAEQVTSTPGGGLNRADREFLSVTLDWAATMKYPLKGWFKSTFTLGAQGFRESDRESDVAATEFGLPGTDDFDNAANLDPRESNQQVFSGGFYFNEQIGLLDRIFVNAGVRFDGNTAFGDEVTLVGYPKFGLAYNVSDEKFWFGGKLLPVLKFRASYGQTGSFPAPFTRDKQFTQGSYLGVVAANFGNPGDPELRPEKTTTLEFGFDAALLDQKIAIEFSLYNDKTTDALFSVPSQPVSGLGFQLRNVGTIENRGIEIALDATVLDMKNARLNIGGSFSTLDNKVTSLGGSTPFNIGGFSFLPLRIEEDHPVGVFQTNVPTSDGDFLANQLIHSPLPDYMFSAFINLSLWKNFRLTAIGSGQTGGQILNTGAVLRYFNGAEPEASMVPEGYNFVTASDVFVEDADFFKIREISMAYTLPVHALGGRYTLSATMRNVLAFAKNRTLDPEMNGFRSVRDVDVGGINFFTLSPPREARLGLIVEL